MSISRIGFIVWFMLYGINHFTGIKAIFLILAIVAIIISVALIVEGKLGRRPGGFPYL